MYISQRDNVLILSYLPQILSTNNVKILRNHGKYIKRGVLSLDEVLFENIL